MTTTTTTNTSAAFTLKDAGEIDRFVLPHQAGIIFQLVDEEGDDGVAYQTVNVTVVFADRTTPDDVPEVSMLAAHAANLVARMLRGEIEGPFAAEAFSQVDEVDEVDQVDA
jgi:hypothetical protein